MCTRGWNCPLNVHISPCIPMIFLPMHPIENALVGTCWNPDKLTKHLEKPWLFLHVFSTFAQISLWQTNSLLLKMTIYTLKIVILHGFSYVYQRVYRRLPWWGASRRSGHGPHRWDRWTSGCEGWRRRADQPTNREGYLGWMNSKGPRLP